jgi:hypothetical protein
MGASETILETQLAPGPLASRRAAVGILEVYAALAIGSFLVARFVPILELVHYPCPFLALTGLPCGTCGMTHAFVLLAHGDVAEALRWSPAGAVLAAVGWTAACADVVRVAAGRSLPAVTPSLLRRASIAGVAAFLVNWAWLMVRGYGP